MIVVLDSRLKGAFHREGFRRVRIVFVFVFVFVVGVVVVLVGVVALFFFFCFFFSFSFFGFSFFGVSFDEFEWLVHGPQEAYERTDQQHLLYQWLNKVLLNDIDILR
jgi:hypothetical protein